VKRRGGGFLGTHFVSPFFLLETESFFFLLTGSYQQQLQQEQQEQPPSVAPQPSQPSGAPRVSIRRRPGGGLGGLMGSMFSPSAAMSPLSDVDYEMQRVMNGAFVFPKSRHTVTVYIHTCSTFASSHLRDSSFFDRKLKPKPLFTPKLTHSPVRSPSVPLHNPQRSPVPAHDVV
jgi:hypothetical protein